jgi:hypothetical protein
MYKAIAETEVVELVRILPIAKI